MVSGAGLGLRRGLLDPLLEAQARGALADVSFYEVAPENWIGIGGAFARKFSRLVAEKPLLCHGLSLSLGGAAPLDEGFLRQVKGFLDTHRVPLYSEHLSACGDEAHLYDLMPIPFTAEAVTYVAKRIRRAQDILERRIAVENVSAYAMPGADMTEPDFVAAVVAEADCDLLLDVNNIYVNSVNFGVDPQAYLAKMPAPRVAYLHVAGHYVEAPDLRIDTHGTAVIDPVWQLLEAAYAHVGPKPTLLERDVNYPPLADLLAEVSTIARLQARHARRAA
jgi:uncharacterized protein (UPF0276 family)